MQRFLKPKKAHILQRKIKLLLNNIKNVTTWSHLATAFNSKPAKKFNIAVNQTVCIDVNMIDCTQKIIKYILGNI